MKFRLTAKLRKYSVVQVAFDKIIFIFLIFGGKAAAIRFTFSPFFGTITIGRLLQGRARIAASNQIEPALKCYFPRLRAFAPLLYVDTAAVAAAQIHRKIPILRCCAVFTSEKDLK